MHDCRSISSRMVDLVFDELKADEKLRLLAELETCADCLNEYRGMAGTLLVFDAAIEASLPEEDFWPGHQAMRLERLEQVNTPIAVRQTRRDPLWKRIFAARLRVPVPVAAVIALALLASSVLALRSSTTTATVPIAAPPTIVLNEATPKTIEVPVYREKVITRTVYIERKAKERNEARRSIQNVRQDEIALTARAAEKESGQGGLFTHANLTDFQPPDEMRIRIVKRSNLR